MTIHVSIERLILDGIPLAPHARPALVAALEAELGLLLAEGGLAPEMHTGSALPRVTAPPIALEPSTPAAELGRQVARAVYAGIGEAGQPGRQGGEL